MAIKALNAKNVLILSAVIILAAGGFFLSKAYPAEDQNVAGKVKALFELANPGITAQVISINEESGLYKIVLKATGAGGTNYKESYVTKDGTLLFDSPVLIQNSTEQMINMKNFVDCLAGKNVKIYGVLNQTFSMAGATATSLQLQALGVYSGNLYVSCDGEFLQGCIQAGIREVPSVVYNNTIYGGPKAPVWFEQTTGCKL